MTGQKTPEIPSKPRILVVEDDYLISIELQSVLEDMGCVVIGPVPTVAEAVVVSRTVAIDAAIVDLILRGEASYPVALSLAAHHVPFGFATGAAFEMDEVWRSHHHITKPYMPDDVRLLLMLLLPAGQFDCSEQASSGT